MGLLFLLAPVLRFFDTLSRVGLIAFMDTILALAVHSLVVRIPLRRGTATAVAALTVIGLAGFAVSQGVAALLPQLRGPALDLPRYQAAVEAWQARLRERTGLNVDLLGSPLESLLQDPRGAGVGLLSRAFGVVEILGIAVLVLAGSVYVAARPNEQRSSSGR